jgi:hypothetical protein
LHPGITQCGAIVAMLAQRMRVDMFPQKVAIGRSEERLAGCVG